MRSSTDTDYFMKAKQRFRTALRKLGVEELKGQITGYKDYQFGGHGQCSNARERKESECSSGNKENAIPLIYHVTAANQNENPVTTNFTSKYKYSFLNNYQTFCLSLAEIFTETFCHI